MLGDSTLAEITLGELPSFDGEDEIRPPRTTKSKMNRSDAIPFRNNAPDWKRTN